METLKTKVENQNKIKCKVVMLPTQKKRQIGQICVNSIQMFLWTEQHEIQDVTNTLVEYHDTRAQHLYLTSREKIQEGDWVLLQKWKGNTPKNTIVKAEINSSNNAIGHKVAGAIMPFEFDSIKIEATTDKNLGIGLISGTFIRKYLEKQGAEMSEVMVDAEAKLIKEYTEQDYVKWGLMNEYANVPKLRKDGTVIISKAKDSWNKKEVKELFAEYSNYRNDGDTEYLEFDEWFEQDI